MNKMVRRRKKGINFNFNVCEKKTKKLQISLLIYFCGCASSSFLSASSTFRGFSRRRRRKTKTKDNNIQRILFIRLYSFVFIIPGMFLFSLFPTRNYFRKNQFIKRNASSFQLHYFKGKFIYFVRKKKILSQFWECNIVRVFYSIPRSSKKMPFRENRYRFKTN